jgi:hypothetical protein
MGEVLTGTTTFCGDLGSEVVGNGALSILTGNNSVTGTLGNEFLLGQLAPIVAADRDRTGKLTFNLRGLCLPDCAQASRGEVPGDSLDTHRILTVWRHRDIDDRIVEAGPSGIGRADRRIFGQLDDTVMLVAQLELAYRAHHPMALDAADCRHLERHVAARNISAGPARQRRDFGLRLCRRAHPPHGVIARHRGQHLPPFGLRGLFRRPGPCRP